MHYLEKWTIRMSKYKDDGFFLWIPVFAKFYTFTFKSNNNVPFRNALRFSSPSHNFHSMFRFLYTLFQIQSQGQQNTFKWLFYYVANKFWLQFKKKRSLGSLPSQELPSLWLSPTPTPVKPLFLWSALHCPTVIFPFIRMGGIGRNRKNAYISLNTAFLLLPSANSVNPFSSTALHKPSERPLLLLPIKAKEIRQSSWIFSSNLKGKGHNIPLLYVKQPFLNCLLDISTLLSKRHLKSNRSKALFCISLTPLSISFTNFPTS